MTFLKLATSLFAAVCSRSQTDRCTSRQPNFVPMTVRTVEKSKYDDLITWLRSKDADVSDKIFIQQSSFGNGCGAFVSEEVKEGDILFTVPRDACVTMKDVTTDPACGKAFSSAIEDAGPGGNTVAMAAYLAKEYLVSLEQEVEFGPYLQTLPWKRGVNNQEHVLFWSDQGVEALRGSFCYDDINRLRSDIAWASKFVDGIVGDSVRIARGEMDHGFRWPWQISMVEGVDSSVRGAFVSLLTRAFTDGNGDEKLVPLLDMCQHTKEGNIRYAKRTDNGTVEVRARRRIAPGEELLAQYRSEDDDNMPYHRFFTRFGFVPGNMEPIENLLADRSPILYPGVEVERSSISYPEVVPV